MSDTSNGEVTKNGRTLILCFDGTSGEYNGEVGVLLFLYFVVLTKFAEHQCRQVLRFAKERRFQPAARLLSGSA